MNKAISLLKKTLYDESCINNEFRENHNEKIGEGANFKTEWNPKFQVGNILWTEVPVAP